MAVASRKNGNWNDGISKELQEMFDELSLSVEGAVDIAKSVIDTEISTYSSTLLRGTPVATGELKGSHSTTKIDSVNQHGGYYGSIIIFEGAYTSGQPHEKVANVLNYGKKDGSILPTKFVSNSIHKLKGMDERINARIEAELSKVT